ncbi:hypothetical protein L1049_010904 [Liquidambar formosana]|uniref:Uncharacterized protein n=1 Tax=Liquidambar formosana TaxID=63359 RepID=A0AAP0WWN8_LIQFO
MLSNDHAGFLCKQNNLPNLLHRGQYSLRLMDHLNRFLLVSLFLMFALLIFLLHDFYSFIESLGVILPSFFSKLLSLFLLLISISSNIEDDSLRLWLWLDAKG